MGSRYASAHDEIKTLLACSPHLTAKQLWRELTVWPLPSERTIQRIAQGVKRYLAVGTDLAANTRNRKAVSATVERADGFSKEYLMAEDKLDILMKHLDSIHTMCEGINTRMAGIEKEHAELKARADTEAKAKADAETMEREKAKADAAAGPRADGTAETRNLFAGAQLKLDSACQAWGHAAPPPLSGETLRNYRIRILSGLKQHSRAYKDSDLATIGDENAFTNIESMIINDAVEASNVSIVPGAPLTRRTRTDANGHRITTFHGDSAIAWSPFMGGGTQFGRINRNP
jgi:hypothetical protein